RSNHLITAFAALRQIRAEHSESRRLTLVQFKEIVKEQYLMLRIDQERAISAVPILLPPDGAERDTALGVMHRVASAAGEPIGETKTRIARIETLFTTATASDGEPWQVAPDRQKNS